jgi:hypothetical protein
MSDHQTLQPELRVEMGDWVVSYVEARIRRHRRLTTIAVSAVAVLALSTASAWVALAPLSTIEPRVSCYAESRWLTSAVSTECWQASRSSKAGPRTRWNFARPSARSAR